MSTDEAKPPPTEEEIIKLLEDMHVGDEDSHHLAKALDQVSDFCNTGRKGRDMANAQLVVEADGIGSIYRVLKKNTNDPKVVSSGARALSNVLHNPDAVAKIHKLGGAETILTGMAEHPEDENVQCNGCGFLASFIIWGSVDSKKVVVDLFGIDAILAAIKDFPTQKVLQKNASVALYALCDVKDYVKALYQAGGLEVLAHAVREHDLDAQGKKFGKRTINALVEYLENMEGYGSGMRQSSTWG